MTSTDKKISEIRALLDRYYAGLSTPGQEQTLADFFSTADTDTIPADMVDDMHLFKTLASLQPDADGPLELPEDLARRLDNITQEENTPQQRKSSEKPRLRPRWWTVIAGIAAAAAIVWGLFTFIPSSDSMSDTTGETLAEADGFIEITDPDEARQIVEHIGGLLATNLSHSDRAISHVGSSFELYKELTKKIF